MGKYGIPLRLGTTSFIYKDDILPNVRKLAENFDDIELLFFESGEYARLPSSDELSELKRIAEENDLSYTVHLPIDRSVGSSNSDERAALFIFIKSLIECLSVINPVFYILHFQGLDKISLDSNFTNQIISWHARSVEFCENLSSANIVDSKKIAVENLFYPIEWHDDIVEKYNFTYCLDIGHLWRSVDNWFDIFIKYVGKADVIHIHGVNSEKDHRAFSEGDRDALETVLNYIIDIGYDSTLTIELFDMEALLSSLKFFKQLLDKRGVKY